ncbi:MAG: hypothetical protein K6G33_07095 [Ruminococcus sp.]|uniref:hypothetical protein n=1 Tax=Ruminococcus sp. TaxID=41978 RepID=UPI0025E370BD|nr:hypothetical protein [Ruminococcus sp.]MCR5600487.1 hypothetical protein [Ruminococcus sp.]
MIFALVCLVGVIFSVLSTLAWFRKKNFLEAFVMGVIMWFFAHIVASMGLFVIDRYTIFRAGCGAAAISAAVFAVMLFRYNGKPFRLHHMIKDKYSIRNMLIPILISLIAVPFVSAKNEFFGMGQDQGVYQTQAILFMNGDTKRQKDLSEYSDLETDHEREMFRHDVEEELRGYDIPNEDYSDTVYDRSVSDVSGIIHGIPTYSALLAMWGTLFGMENMQGFETIIYICLIFLVHFICRNLKLKDVTSFCACVGTAAAPVVIWVAKSSLTEMILSLIPVLFLYFLTDDEAPDSKWLSVIPIAVFGCYHVSLYTMLPMFVLIYGGMYVFTRERQYAVLMPVTVAGYLGSYFMMRQIQPMYTMNNYSPVFFAGVNVNNITTVITIVSAAAFAAVLLFVFIVNKRTPSNFSATKFARGAGDSKVFNMLLRLMLILPTAFIIVRAVLKYSGWSEASHLTLVGFAVNTGLILFPLGVVFACISPKFFAERPQKLVLFIMFFYCILFYSMFLRLEIQHYYYYSRYLAPFIPIAMIFCAAVLDRFGGKLLIPVTAAGIIYLVPYDTFLMQNKDDSRIEWSILSDLTDFVDENDCIVISRGYVSRLWLPMRSMTGAKIVPEDENDPEQIERLAARYGGVLVLTDKSLYAEDYTLVYSNVLHHIEDDLNTTGKIAPMSLGYWSVDEDIRIYFYDKYRFMYTAAEDYDRMSGVSGLESSFCWTDSEEAQVECLLYPDDYNITLELGGALPLDMIGTDSFEVTLLLDGEKVGTQFITADNNGGKLHYRVDEDKIKDGENVLEIQTPLWKAAVLNPADTRTLGIPIKSVRFSPAS